jgi:Ser-Thr-rich glycosyl-phosphatidyl-inositol-anchored membrane family
VTLLLLRGPSTNVVPILTIAETIPNTGSYVWSSVPTDLEPDTTGYGIQLIVEGSGAYQYSPQCGVQNDGYTGSSSSSSSIISMSSSTSVDHGSDYHTSSPPSTYTLVSASSASSTTSSMIYVTYKTAPSSPAGTGGANFSVPVLTPTNSMSVPATLQPTGPANNATMTTRAASSTAAVPPAAATGGAAATNNVFVVNAVALALAGGVAGVLAF